MKLMTREEVLEYAENRKEVCIKLKKMIVEQLCLEMDPLFIADDQPLFGRGLELDSIDALELAVGIYDTYGIILADGDTQVFSSVNTMADYVMENKDKTDEKGESDLISNEGFIDLDD